MELSYLNCRSPFPLHHVQTTLAGRKWFILEQTSCFQLSHSALSLCYWLIIGACFTKARKILLLQCCQFLWHQQHLLFRYLYSHIHTFIFLISKKSFSQNISGKNTGKYNENYRGRTIKKFKAIKIIGFGLGACIIIWMPDLILLCVNCYYVITNDSGEIHSSAFVA